MQPMQRSRRRAGTCARWLWVAVLAASLPAASVRAREVAPVAYTEFELANGLRVVLHEDRSTPLVAISVMYHVGSKNERPDRTGFAHFFEHLLFGATQHLEDGEFAALIQNAGGTYNGTTNADRTHYFEVLPSNQLELGLWLEAERMFLARIEERGVETQREVVKEERRQSYDNVPYAELLEIGLDAAYSVHPYRWPTIGSIDHLNAATIEEFRAFYETFYVPGNAVLAIAGDLDPEGTRALVERYFGEIPAGEGEIPRPTAVEPLRKQELRKTVYGPVELPAVVMGFQAPAQSDPDFYALGMLMRVLADGGSARLNREVREEQELALFLTALTVPTEHPGLAGVAGVTALGVSADRLEAAIDAQIERVRAEPISERELQRVRNQTERSFLEQRAGVLGISSRLAEYALLYDDTSRINSELGRFLEVTPADLQRVAQTYLARDRRVVIHYFPESVWKRLRNRGLMAWRFVRDLF